MADAVYDAILASRLVSTWYGQLNHLAHPVGYTRTLCGLRVDEHVTGEVTCSRCRKSFEREVSRA